MNEDTGPTYGQLKIRLENANKTIELQRNELFNLRGDINHKIACWVMSTCRDYMYSSGTEEFDVYLVRMAKELKERI